MLRTGLVGLPNVGKSTLFNALVRSNAAALAANYPFATIDPQVGTVVVPDPRLDVLKDISGSERTVPTAIRVVDIAGLVKGASAGEGMGNAFLSHVREVDAIIHVVRCFEDPDIIHVHDSVDPVRDIDVINMELALADLSTVEKALARVSRARSKGNQEAALMAGALERIQPVLSEGRPARVVDDLSDDETVAIRSLGLITRKPMLYAANVGEDDVAAGGNRWTEEVAALAAGEGHGAAGMAVIAAGMEAELLDLDEVEAAEYRQSVGGQETGLGTLSRGAYDLLGLQTFFTTGVEETRAWPVRKGSTAPQAGRVIHSDFETGFIKAETVGFDDLVASGSMEAARKKGLVRNEGKEYIVAEGDVMLFKHR